MQTNSRINNIGNKTNFGGNAASKMEFGSVDADLFVEDSSISLVVTSYLFMTSES